MLNYQYSNPYYDQDFFGFLLQIFLRLWGFLTGQLGYTDLVSDEIQMLTLIGVAASAGIVGTFLVLRKMTMLANAISHTILVGIVGAFLMTHHGLLGASDSPAINIKLMLFAALIVGVFTSLLTEFLVKSVKLQEDASTGLVFTTLFAIGIIMVTLLTRNAHIGAEVVMGNVDVLNVEDLKLVYIILGVNVVLFLLFFKEFAITTFDPGLAKALGFSIAFFNYLIMVQSSATVVGAFRAVGVLMVLAFITGPALTARLLTHDLKKMVALAVGLGCLASVVGVALARHILTIYGVPLTTGGIVVCVIIAIFVLSTLFAPEKGLIPQYLHNREHKNRKIEA